MSAFYYCATLDESLVMLRDLCGHGFQVVASRTYDEPSAPRHDRVTDQLVEELREGPGYFLAGGFTRSPVRLRKLSRGPAADKYIVDALAEGPVLEGLLARTNRVDGEQKTMPGFVSHQPQYRDLESGLWRKATPELKAAYKLAVSTMKKHLVKTELAKVLVGREVLALVREGKVRLLDHYTT